MVSKSGIREIVGGVEPRAVPQLIEVPVKLVGAGLGDVIDLRRAVAPLVHGIGERVHRDFRDGVQSEHQIGRESAVQIRQRIIRFQPIDDIAVGERRQSIELHVAIPVGAAHKIVATPRRVDQRARGKLQRVGQITPGIRKIFQRPRI